MAQRRRKSHVEGLATHDDPESCGRVRKDAPEALTGAHAGRVLSREIEFNFQVPRLFLESKAMRATPRMARCGETWRGRMSKTPSMRRSTKRENWEALMPPDRAAVGSQQAHATDVRQQGV